MTYLQRYQGGEHSAVWDELIAMGEDARARKIREDAQAVAHETMRRVRKNIEILTPRLRELGYRFHSTKPFVPAQRKTPELIKRFEKTLSGRLPFSLVAWWEKVEEVSFLGDHPILQPAGADPLVFRPLHQALEAIEDWTGEPPFFPPPGAWETSIEAWRRSLRAEGHSPAEVEAKLAPSIVLFQEQDRENQDILAQPFDPRFRFAFAPDELTKADVKGKTFDILLPSPGADLVLEGAVGRPYFVEYLRQSLGHGGFRGWAGNSRAPIKEIEKLTAGLLPF